MKVAIIGTGNIGGTLARSLSRAGHDVVLGVRDPAKADALAGATGATIASPRDAAAAGDAVIVAIPFAGWPELAGDISEAVSGKVVVDAGNPYPDRDGDMAREAVADGRGSALSVAAWLPGAQVAKAFNTLFWRDLSDKAGQGFGMAFAADGAAARATAETLIRDAGFEPVSAGGLADSRRFDPGAPAYGSVLTPAALPAALARAPEHPTTGE